MKSTSLFLLAALGLVGCDSSPSKKVATQASEAPSATAPGTEASTSIEPGARSSGPDQAPGTSPGPTRPADVALPAGLKTGRWQGFLTTQQRAIHFVFEVAVEENKAVVSLINKGLKGEERLRCGNVRAAGDSAIIRLQGSGSALVVRAEGVGRLTGTWVQNDSKKPFRVPFVGVYGERSPIRAEAKTPDFAGTWRVTFKQSNGHTYAAVGIFEQSGANLVGTFLTPAGDYRLLSGAALPAGLGISTFDGSHGYLFQASKLPNGNLKGEFYSDKSGHETWTAVPDPKAKLPVPMP